LGLARVYFSLLGFLCPEFEGRIVMRDVITIEANIDGETIMADMHHDPHAEEIAALVAAEDLGDKAFLAEYCGDGKLRLGTGGGPFDEHSNRETGEGRKKGCCMTLMADVLDL